MAAGRGEGVVMVKAVTAIKSARDTLRPALSLTVAVKLLAPPAEGVPVMAPVVALSERPAGRLPVSVHA